MEKLIVSTVIACHLSSYFREWTVQGDTGSVGLGLAFILTCSG